MKLNICETSVWKTATKIKDSHVTESGYLDLTKVAGLRVYASKILKLYRKKLNFTQEQMANILKTKRGNICYWESGHAVPITVLLKMIGILGKNKESLFRDLSRNNVNFGISNSKAIKLPIHMNQLDKASLSKMKPYIDSNRVYYDSKTSSQMVLSRFLKTFIIYQRKLKFQLPMTKIAKEWHESNLNLNVPIITLLLTEGCLDTHKRKGIIFTNNSKYLHQILVDCIFFKYNLLPTSYFRKAREYPNPTYVTTYTNIKHLDMIEAILKLVNNLKTSPHDNQTIPEYEYEPQPTIKLISNLDVENKKIFLNVLSSCEGSVHADLDSRCGLVGPVIEIACAHPKLIEEIKEILQQLGLKFGLQKSKKTWSGVKSLRSRGIISTLKFLKLGGFLYGVKTTSKSKYFNGIEKQLVVLSILEFRKRQLENKELKHLSRIQIYHEIKKIIKKNEVENIDFYYNFFSNRNKIKRWLH